MFVKLLASVLFALVLIKSSHGQNGTQIVDRNKRDVRTRTVLSGADKQAAVEYHNEARLAVQPGAANMIKLVWDEELAQLAETYSRRCIYAHSSTVGTSKFSSPGENLYIRSAETSPKSALEIAVKRWDAEKNDYNYNSNTCSGVCGHYTQVVWARTKAVGCGMTTCNNIHVGGGDTFRIGQLVVCNYGPGGNFQGFKPYESGPSCSKCPQGETCLCGSESVKSNSLVLVFFCILTGLLNRVVL